MAIIRVTNVPSTALSDDVITSAKIADGTIAVSDLANDSVTADKIASNAVTSAKIADSNITTAKIADSNITTAKVADNAITTGHMHSSVPLGTKNLILNGDMRIDQRNNGASVSVSSSTPYTLDRWKAFGGGAVFSVQRNLNSITPPKGFTNYLGVSVTTSNVPTGTETHIIRQQIEGYNIAHLGWGTTEAKTITISFWVRSSLTGTFGGTLKNGPDATYPYTYTIDSADTWEKKIITIVGATSNTWNAGNSTGIFAQWSLGSGSSVLGTPGSWNYSANLNGATGETSVIGTTGATWYITGVQIEVGEVATEFEHLPYDVQLARCERYFQWVSRRFGYARNSSNVLFNHSCRVPMRATPSLGLQTTSPYVEWAPWAAISSTSGCTVNNGHMDQWGGDINLAGTISNISANQFVELGYRQIYCESEL